MSITRVIIFIALFLLIYRPVFLFCKRITAIRKLSELKKECGATIRHLRSPFASLFRIGEGPDLAVSVGRQVYLCRFINGRGKHNFFHFASEKFFVTFSKTRHVPGIGAPGLRMGAGGSAFGFVTTKSRRAGILPKLQIPDEYIKISPSDEREIIPVLIFNPAPGEVSYVTEEKSSIKIAFSGDEFRGEKIFTPTTFVIWADRKKRQDFNEKL